MMRKQIFLVLSTALTLVSVSVQHVGAQQSPVTAGTWFGSIVLTNPDGRISHDNAVLIIEKVGSTVSGSMGRTIDQLTPWTEGNITNSQLTFHLNAAGGLNVGLTLADGRLAGTATGQGINAQIDLKPAPGLVPHQQLRQEILSVDQQLYEAFGNCDVVTYASLLSKDLEFYQDHTGETGYDENVKALRDRCAEGILLSRELDQESLVVNAAPGFGAIQAGTQRFYSRSQDGKEHLDATARFTNVWTKQSGAWKLVRVISYDHH